MFWPLYFSDNSLPNVPWCTHNPTDLSFTHTSSTFSTQRRTEKTQGCCPYLAYPTPLLQAPVCISVSAKVVICPPVQQHSILSYRNRLTKKQTIFFPPLICSLAVMLSSQLLPYRAPGSEQLRLLCPRYLPSPQLPTPSNPAYFRCRNSWHFSCYLFPPLFFPPPKSSLTKPARVLLFTCPKNQCTNVFSGYSDW